MDPGGLGSFFLLVSHDNMLPAAQPLLGVRSVLFVEILRAVKFFRESIFYERQFSSCADPKSSRQCDWRDSFRSYDDLDSGDVGADSGIRRSSSVEESRGAHAKGGTVVRRPVFSLATTGFIYGLDNLILSVGNLG